MDGDQRGVFESLSNINDTALLVVIYICKEKILIGIWQGLNTPPYHNQNDIFSLIVGQGA